MRVAAAAAPPISPEPPLAGPVPHALRGSPYAGPWGGRNCVPLGGGRAGLFASGPGGGLHLPLDVNDSKPPPPPLPPLMDAHGKPCYVHPLKPLFSHHLTRDSPMMPAVVTVPSSPIPRLHPPVSAQNPVGKHAHRLLPLGQVGTPQDHKGAGKGDAEFGLHPLGLHGQVPHGREMPLPPVWPGRHPLRLSRVRLPGG